MPPTLLKTTGAGMIASVLLGCLAAIVALGKAFGWWRVAPQVPVVFAALGVAGSVLLVVFLVALVRHVRARTKGA